MCDTEMWLNVNVDIGGWGGGHSTSRAIHPKAGLVFLMKYLQARSEFSARVLSSAVMTKYAEYRAHACFWPPKTVYHQAFSG